MEYFIKVLFYGNVKLGKIFIRIKLFVKRVLGENLKNLSISEVVAKMKKDLGGFFKLFFDVDILRGRI